MNDAPVAADDSAATDVDAAVDVDVLANDSDIDGDTPVITGFSQGASGAVTQNADGTLRYTPNPGFDGADAFTYDIDDGNGGVATATVAINVGANGAVSGVDDGYSVDEDATLSVAGPGVLGNDLDADGDALTAVLSSDVSNGTLVLNGDGSFDYTPDADFNGVDSFVYSVSDGFGSADTATVTITVDAVNDAPVALDDGAVTDVGVGVDIDVLGNDGDVDGDTLTVVSVSQGANGAVAINADGTVNYTPVAGFSGADAFTYDVADGNGGVATATVDVTVAAPGLFILGTPDNDRLDGTEGNDTFDPLGGLRDEMEGFGGADLFDFASSTGNGVEERKVIADFNAAEGDLINLGDASVASHFVRNGNLVIDLTGDEDTIVLRDFVEFDDISFV